MKKTLVSVMSIFCLSSTLYAGEIYNCKMNKFIFLQDDEVSESKLSDFSFEVQRDELVFSDGGFFDGANLSIRYKNKGWIEATDETDVFVIEDGRFHYSLVTSMNVRSASGVCENHK